MIFEKNKLFFFSSIQNEKNKQKKYDYYKTFCIFAEKMEVEI